MDYGRIVPRARNLQRRDPQPHRLPTTIRNVQASSNPLKCDTFEVRFEGFKSLPRTKGVHYANSPEFTCLGHRWALCVYPGGDYGSDPGYVSLYLFLKSDGDIEVRFHFIVKGSQETKAVAYHDDIGNFHQPSLVGGDNFAKRSALCQSLDGGALIIEVQIRETEPANLKPVPVQFIPKNQLHQNILKKFEDKASANVVFEIGNEEARSGRKKRAKTQPTLFYAHRFIIQQCTPFFAELCEETDGLSPIPIFGVKPEVFHLVMYYAYGGKIANEDLEAHAKDIIDAADKCGMVNLKLEAEAYFVRSTAITIDNVMESLLYADAKTCPLLKEAAIDFVVENGNEVLKKIPLKDIPGGMFADLLAAVSRGKEKDAGSKTSDDLNIMRVNDLRRKLDEKGMIVDGSREAMIAALNESP